MTMKLGCTQESAWRLRGTGMACGMGTSPIDWLLGENRGRGNHLTKAHRRGGFDSTDGARSGATAIAAPAPRSDPQRTAPGGPRALEIR
jgi:hypothetical protein